MPVLDASTPELKESLAGPIHLLGIGHTKSGKTDYAVQAAIDGFELLYVDNDNGMATISHALANHPEALKRVHYFSPLDMAGFIESLLTEPVLRYNVSLREIYTRTKAKPEHRISEIYPSRIPKNTILVIDSWTTFTYSILKAKAKAEQVDLLDIDKYSREIYGGAGFKVTQVALSLQAAPFHVYVQAHAGVLERKEKPPGVVREVTERDMIIRETVAVPLSTSLPHGLTLGKYFNQIGWFEVNQFDKRVLDFTVKKNRVGGGTPNKVGDPRVEFRFSKLFATPTPADQLVKWENEYTFAEYLEVEKVRQAARPTLASLTTKPAPAKPAASAAVVKG